MEDKRRSRQPADVRDEEGQALFEMALVLMLFLVVFLGILAVAPRIYTRLAVDTAAYDCATAAVETLDQGRGRFQGATAARETLIGFRLDPERFSTRVVAPEWGRGQPVTCIITYNHGPSLVPWMNSLFGPSPSTTQGRVTLLIATFKSRW